MPEYKHYIVTGVDIYGRRFSILSSNYFHANGINLYKGSLWGVRKDNTRKLLKRVI